MKARRGCAESSAWFRACASLAALLFVVMMLTGVSVQPAQAQIHQVLYRFSGKDGASPYGGLLRDESGNLYGTAISRGKSGFFCVPQVGIPDMIGVISPL